MSQETPDVWPRRRHRRHRRNSLYYDDATTVSNDAPNDPDVSPSRQNPGETSEYSLGRRRSSHRTDTGDSRRVYFYRGVNRSLDRSHSFDEHNRRSGTGRNVVIIRDRPSRYRYSPVAGAVARFMGDMTSVIAPETICSVFTWSYALVVVASLTFSVVYSSITSNPGGGFGIGTFFVAAGSLILVPRQLQHLQGCRCTPESKTRSEALENSIKSRHFFREIDVIHERINEFQSELGMSRMHNRAVPPTFPSPRAPTSPDRSTRDLSRPRRPTREGSIVVMSDSDDERPTVVTPVTRESEDTREVAVELQQEKEADSGAVNTEEVETEK